MPSGPGSGPEGGLAQKATATSTPSTLSTSAAMLPATETLYPQEGPSSMPPAVEAFTPNETAPNSVKVTGNTGT